MSYSNEFLRNFRPVFLAILKAQSFRPERVELVVIDEEQSHVFEPADVRDVLEQIGDDLNYLTVYTGRPAYFSGFAERMYETERQRAGGDGFSKNQTVCVGRTGGGERNVSDPEGNPGF